MPIASKTLIKNRAKGCFKVSSFVLFFGIVVFALIISLGLNLNNKQISKWEQLTNLQKGLLISILVFSVILAISICFYLYVVFASLSMIFKSDNFWVIFWSILNTLISISFLVLVIINIVMSAGVCKEISSYLHDHKDLYTACAWIIVVSPVALFLFSAFEMSCAKN